MSGLSARTYSCGGDAGRFFFDGGDVALVLRAPFLRYASSVPALGKFDKSSSSVSMDSADESEDKSESDIAKGLMGVVDYARPRGWQIGRQLETTNLYEQARWQLHYIARLIFHYESRSFHLSSSQTIGTGY